MTQSPWYGDDQGANRHLLAGLSVRLLPCPTTEGSSRASGQMRQP
jgi:hypothetical protein